MFMKRKIIFISCICILLLCGCNNKQNTLSTDDVDKELILDNSNDKSTEIVETDSTDVDIVNNEVHTNNQDEKKNNNNSNSIKKDNVVVKSDSNNNEKKNSNDDKKSNNDSNNNFNNNSNNDTSNNLNDVEEPIIGELVVSNDNSVDPDSLDYPVHKGRVDCSDLNDCMNKSLPVQYEFKKSITNSFYLEVIAKSGKSLGYFIEYVFKENNRTRI